MGCVGTHDLYHENPIAESCRPNFNEIGLNYSDVSKFNKLFLKLAKENTQNRHKVSMVSLLNFIDEDPNNFVIKILALFNPDGKNTDTLNDLLEFVFALWNFGTIDENSLVKYSFFVYSIEMGENSAMKERKIESHQLTQMAKDAYGYDYAKNPLARKIIDRVDNKSLSSDEFSIFLKTHSKLLYPITILQLKLRKIIFGSRIWRRFRRHRRNMTEEQLFRSFLRVNPNFLGHKVESGEREDRSKRTSFATAPSASTSANALGLHMTGTPAMLPRQRSDEESRASVASRRSSVDGAPGDLTETGRHHFTTMDAAAVSTRARRLSYSRSIEGEEGHETDTDQMRSRTSLRPLQGIYETNEHIEHSTILENDNSSYMTGSNNASRASLHASGLTDTARRTVNHSPSNKDVGKIKRRRHTTGTDDITTGTKGDIHDIRQQAVQMVMTGVKTEALPTRARGSILDTTREGGTSSSNSPYRKRSRGRSLGSSSPHKPPAYTGQNVDDKTAMTRRGSGAFAAKQKQVLAEQAQSSGDHNERPRSARSRLGNAQIYPQSTTHNNSQQLHEKRPSLSSGTHAVGGSGTEGPPSHSPGKRLSVHRKNSLSHPLNTKSNISNDSSTSISPAPRRTSALLEKQRELLAAREIEKERDKESQL